MFDLKALNAMSSDELRALNKTIAFIVNERVRAACVKAAQMVTVGQKVNFAGKYGPMAGTVTRVKVKMVEVDCGPQGKWNVAGSLLKAA